MTTNEPIEAWVLQVYMRDRGCYLWIGPSIEVYGGFAAFVEKYEMFLGMCRITEVVSDCFVQVAARRAAEQVAGFDYAAFEAWRTEWEKTNFRWDEGEDTQR